MEKTAKRKKIHKICLYITHTHSQYTWRHDTNTVTQSLQNFTHTTHRPVSQFSLTKKIDPFHNPRRGSRGHGENSFFFKIVSAICVAVVEARCEGSRGSRGEWREGSRGCEHEFFFFFFLSHSVSLSHGSDVANIYWLAPDLMFSLN